MRICWNDAPSQHSRCRSSNERCSDLDEACVAELSLGDDWWHGAATTRTWSAAGLYLRARPDEPAAVVYSKMRIESGFYCCCCLWCC